jgi:hypothetical protein
MSRFFSLEDIKVKAVEQSKSEILRDKFVTLHERKIESIKQLAGDLPGNGEIFFIWTDNSFNAFTFIPYVIKQCKCIQNLIISTYSINARIVDSLVRYIDMGKILKVDILISDSMKYRMPKVVDHLSSMVTQRQQIINVSYGWNHSKITLMEAADNFYLVEGSGNWSENSRNEQYIFMNSRQAYEFRAKCIRNATD